MWHVPADGGVTDERWSPVPGWPAYEVSDIGRVRSIVRRGPHKPKILNTFPNNGYWRANLCHNGRRHLCDIHVLVALAFLGPKPSPDAEVNHINGIKLDPRLENLEWTDRQGNAQHAHDTGLQVCKGEKNGHSKLTDSAVRSIRVYGDRSKDSAHALAVAFNVSYGTILDVWSRRTWNHLSDRARAA